MWEELKRLRVEIIINTMERDFKHEVFDLLMGWNRVARYARQAGAVSILLPTNDTNLHKYYYNIDL